MSEHQDKTGQWYVYILECADDSLYTGITNNLQKRLEQHNAGKGARYTRARLPVSMVYQESASDRASASKREYCIKQLNRREKQKLISD